VKKEPQQWRKELGLDALEGANGLPRGFLTAVLTQESAGDSNAGSGKGAKGLFQFMPATATQYHVDVFDPQSSADGAAKMYGELSKKYDGDLNKMLAAYNWGQGNVDKKGMEEAPRETRGYIANINNNLKILGSGAILAASDGQYADAAKQAEATNTNAGREFAKKNKDKAAHGKVRNPNLPIGALDEEDSKDQNDFISDMMQENPIVGLFLFIIF
jgi:hypothetical protein